MVQLEQKQQRIPGVARKRIEFQAPPQPPGGGDVPQTTPTQIPQTDRDRLPPREPGQLPPQPTPQPTPGHPSEPPKNPDRV